MFKARSRTGFDRNLQDEKRLDAIVRNIEYQQERNLRKKKTRFYSRDFATFVRFECQLYLGDSPFPRKRFMSVFQRSKCNKRFEDAFEASFDEKGETKKRLSQWRFVSYKKVKEAKESYIQARLEGISLNFDEDFCKKYGCEQEKEHA